MKDHFPRTALEFRRHGRLVVVRRDDCDRNRAVNPEVLILEFGEDFDIYAGMKELQAQLRCDACGERHRIIYVHNTQQKPFGPVSHEQSIANAMELNAYSRATGKELPTGLRNRRRRR